MRRVFREKRATVELTEQQKIEEIVTEMTQHN
jgi:hypothetical protein